MAHRDVKRLAARLDSAQAILDEVRAESGFDALGKNRIAAAPRCETALQAAQRAYDDRRDRFKEFEEKLFGEPAWDILLDLFIHQAREEAVTVKSACLGSGASAETAMRWLKVLEHEGLIATREDPREGQRHLVRMTPEGYESMLRYLETIAREC